METQGNLIMPLTLDDKAIRVFVFVMQIIGKYQLPQKIYLSFNMLERNSSGNIKIIYTAKI